MNDVYEKCPDIETDKVLLRFACKEDAGHLLKIYSDKNALPFFNSDNCHGDNFYYPTKEKMDSAIDFWLDSYFKKWFVRWVIVDKAFTNIIGSVELFHRSADDDFNGVGVLRILLMFVKCFFEDFLHFVDRKKSNLNKTCYCRPVVNGYNESGRIYLYNSIARA